MSDIQLALAYARGIPGVMRPCPDAGDATDAMNLLRYAAMIEDADEKDPQWKPEWFWNVIAKISLRYWQWKYKGLAEARIREWYEESRTIAPARRHASSAPTVEPQDKRKT